MRSSAACARRCRRRDAAARICTRWRVVVGEFCCSAEFSGLTLKMTALPAEAATP
jgi:hypothetical protein